MVYVLVVRVLLMAVGVGPPRVIFIVWSWAPAHSV
jgi:hypothetical protein